MKVRVAFPTLKGAKKEMFLTLGVVCIDGCDVKIALVDDNGVPVGKAGDQISCDDEIVTPVAYALYRKKFLHAAIVVIGAGHKPVTIENSFQVKEIGGELDGGLITIVVTLPKGFANPDAPKDVQEALLCVPRQLLGTL